MTTRRTFLKQLAAAGIGTGALGAWTDLQRIAAAASLSDAQSARLTEVLTRIYGHPVSVQLHINPDLLGGLNITVGDEVIDGTLSSKLAAAETKLPD